MIFDLQSSLSGDLKRKLEENLVMPCCLHPKLPTSMVTYFTGILKKGFFPPSEQPLRKIIDNWHFYG